MQVYPDTWFHDPRFIAGVIMFFTGVWINTNSDDRLRNLRRPGESGYKIPTGGMFEYVSGANFLGEIIEWTGFALAAGSKCVPRQGGSCVNWGFFLDGRVRAWLCVLGQRVLAHTHGGAVHPCLLQAGGVFRHHDGAQHRPACRPAPPVVH